MARKDRPETSLLPVEQAQELALQGVRRPPAVKTPLSDAIGLVLSDDVVSDRDMPPFDRAAVDGYAVVASDLQSAVESAPVLLSVVEEVQAGVVPTKAVATGHTSKVMTGAPTPAGADAMVMVERTRSKHGSVVEFTTPVTVGQNIRPQGEDARKGDRVLGAGQVVGPPEAGILTSVGVIDPVVYPRPTLAVLSTGDEVVDPSQQPKPGQIRDSNGPLLTAQARRAGVEVTQLGIASDTFESLSRLIEQGLKSDVLVIAGGVSMGDHDIVEDVLLEFGFEMSFDRVNMKPGKPTVFGRCGDTYVFGLPGNPVSGLVAFGLFVRPLLRKVMGHHEPLPPMWPAVIDVDLRSSDPRRTYQPVSSSWKDGIWHATPVDHHSSGDLRSIALADSLLVIPENSGGVEKGSHLDLVRLTDL